MSKSSHETARYQWSPKGGERCAVCTMFRPPADCSSVESPISPEGWCSYFASRAAAMNKAARETDQHPSEAQKKAGNYTKGEFNWMGATITIENPMGSIRRGVGKDGKPWECKQPAHYGYINATKAVDGDHVDVYLGHAPASQRVWVIDQIDPDSRRYDEPKCMLSFPSKDVAVATYRRAFTDGKDRVGGVTEMTIPHFMKWKDTQAKHKRKGYAAGGGVRPHYGYGGGSGEQTTITSSNGQKWTVGSAYASRFQGLINDLEAAGYHINESGGGYNPRNIRRTNTPSMHALGHGAAIDIDPSDNAQGTVGRIPPGLARQLAAKYDMKWGGDFGDPDPMHFQVAQRPMSASSTQGAAPLGGADLTAGDNSFPSKLTNAADEIASSAPNNYQSGSVSIPTVQIPPPINASLPTLRTLS